MQLRMKYGLLGRWPGGIGRRWYSCWLLVGGFFLQGGRGRRKGLGEKIPRPGVPARGQVLAADNGAGSELAAVAAVKKKRFCCESNIPPFCGCVVPAYAALKVAGSGWYWGERGMPSRAGDGVGAGTCVRCPPSAAEKAAQPRYGMDCRRQFRMGADNKQASEDEYPKHTGDRRRILDRCYGRSPMHS